MRFKWGNMCTSVAPRLYSIIFIDISGAFDTMGAERPFRVIVIHLETTYKSLETFSTFVTGTFHFQEQLVIPRNK